MLRSSRPCTGGRGGVEVGGGGDLDDLAGVHHRDAIAEPGDDAEVVGDQQHGEAEPLLQVGDADRGSGPGS